MGRRTRAGDMVDARRWITDLVAENERLRREVEAAKQMIRYLTDTLEEAQHDLEHAEEALRRG